MHLNTHPETLTSEPLTHNHKRKTSTLTAGAVGVLSWRGKNIRGQGLTAHAGMIDNGIVEDGFGIDDPAPVFAIDVGCGVQDVGFTVRS